MKKRILLIISLIVLSSCRHQYFDDAKFGNDINYGDFGFKSSNNTNIFYCRVKMGLKADKEITYFQHYDIEVPKKIKKWLFSGTEFFIEYDNNQIVMINANKEIMDPKVITNWIEAVDNNSLNHISDYYKSVYHKKWNFDAKNKVGRITKTFKDGHTTIVLYNIKPDNIKQFEKIKNTLKYIKYDN